MDSHQGNANSSRLSHRTGAPSAPAAALRDLRLAAARVRALLPRRDRSEPRLGALKIPDDGVGATDAGAVFGLERPDLLVALCAFGVLRLERA